MSVKIAIGLGNSGAKYADTRHNAGRIALECFARECGAVFAYNKYCAAHTAKVQIGSHSLILAVADGFMNVSGAGLKKILNFYKFQTSDTVVLYDDITLEVGRMKLSKGGSSGGHNGVADIMDKCGNDFVRVRIGIGGKPDKRMDLADYVLGRLDTSDLNSLKGLKIGECMRLLVAKGLDKAQNEINRKDSEVSCGASQPVADKPAAEKIAEPEKKRGIISRLFGI